MRKIISIFISCIFLLACNESITIQENEALQQQVFQSVEFQTLKKSYTDFHEYKMNEIKKIIEEGKTGKVSHEKFIENRETYLQNCADKMKDVAKKNQIVFDKFPKLKENIEISALLEQMQEEFKNN